eukprot:jgi/Tetstr1/446363/TSEL_033905.t1
MAEEAGLDLVEIAPNSSPPVCKILDYGRYKYQSQKKAAEARKKQKVVEVKEIKMRPNIDTHDYEVKMRNMKRFFDEGDKVKVTLRFRGREMAHQDLGIALLNKVRDETAEYAKVESHPRLEGRQMVMPPPGKKGCKMPKLKTKSGAKKRFKLTATGKVKTAQAGKRHGMIKRSNKFIRNARGTTTLSEPDARIVKQFLPYG